MPERERVYGPHANRSKLDRSTIVSWRVVYRNPAHPDPTRRRTHFTYPATQEGYEAALRRAEILRRTISDAPLSISDLLGLYEVARTNEGLRSFSRRCRRVRAVLQPILNLQLKHLPEASAASAYAAYCQGRAPATHRQALIEVKTFVRWCHERGHCRRNPFDKVKGVGIKNRGKPQLSGDELVLLMAECFRVPHTVTGDLQRALAVELAFIYGMRAGEIVALRGRDVDLDATILRVMPHESSETRGKTLTAKRILDVMPGSRPRLRTLLQAFGRDRKLLDYHPSWVTSSVRTMAKRAGILSDESDKLQWRRCSAHALRGAHSSLATRHGQTAAAVAVALGQSASRDCAVTRNHYIQAGSLESGSASRVLSLIQGGLEGDSEGTVRTKPIPAVGSDRKSA